MPNVSRNQRCSRSKWCPPRRGADNNARCQSSLKSSGCLPQAEPSSLPAWLNTTDVLIGRACLIVALTMPYRVSRNTDSLVATLFSTTPLCFHPKN
eukprot:5572300-Amphidinium_carterae.1